MLVQKFGGTSLGSPKRMTEVVRIITQNDQPSIVVLSAIAGTTNSLEEINSYWINNDGNTTLLLTQLKEEYHRFLSTLFENSYFRQLAFEGIEPYFNTIDSWINKTFSPNGAREILAMGELLSTKIFSIYLASKQIKSDLISALHFMVTDQSGEPNIEEIKNRITEQLSNINSQIVITQGYICRDDQDLVNNLKRGGSDYTATLIGSVIQSDEIQIWTDIDGMHNNDPRYVNHTSVVHYLSYQEASELAYFGAKILHPSCVIPAQKQSIPIRLKSTFDPEASGTLISNKSSGKKVAAIAAKDDITVIKVRSGRMFNAYGFLKSVFEVFEDYQTPIDMVTTSEISVSITIDDDSKLLPIINDLSIYGDISFDKNQSIICIVGDRLSHCTSIKPAIINAFDDIPIRMISYGGSLNNISILLDTKYKQQALEALQTRVVHKRRVA